MFKEDIDRAVVDILRELRRNQQKQRTRAKEMAAKAAAQAATGSAAAAANNVVIKAPRPLYVSGLKQVLKLCRSGRSGGGVGSSSLRAVVVAANIEAQSGLVGGLDDMLEEIMELSAEQRVPIIFALDRVRLGRAVGLANTVSALGVLDLSAVGDAYRALLQRVREAQEEWRMLQEDTLLNPLPAHWGAALAAEEALLAQRREQRAKRKREHDTAVARADEEKRAYRLAQIAAGAAGASGGGGGAAGKGKKKKGGASSGRELLPLPVLSEEDAKRGRRKGRRRKGAASAAGAASSSASASAFAAGAAASSSSSTSLKLASSQVAQLKGAGRALSAIAEALASDDNSKAASKQKGATSVKAAKKGDKDATVDAEPSGKKKGGPKKSRK
jgi:ribosomal protein L7Ae-like RNA K-turn-binding protein